MMCRLVQEEVIFVGMSSGGVVMAVVCLIENFDEGLIVCIICDCGDCYFFFGIFE